MVLEDVGAAEGALDEMTGGSELRKHWQKAKERYRRTAGVEPPVEAQLLVSVSTDRYGLVRIPGTAEVVCDAVDDAYVTGPDDALSLGQQAYRGSCAGLSRRG